MIERLTILQANKGQFANGSELFNACKSSYELRHEIEVLAKFYLNRQVSGCQNCYMDAYIELINYNTEKAMNKETCDFKLRAGALLRDVVNNDKTKLCSNANITDELALYHLRTNPNSRKYFEKLPKNIDELIDGAKVTTDSNVDDEQENSEKELVAEIVTMLKAGSTKTAIREKFEQTTVGTKKITQRMMTDFLKLANSVISPEA